MRLYTIIIIRPMSIYKLTVSLYQGVANRGKSCMKFRYLTYLRFVLYFKNQIFIKMSLRFQYLYFKRSSLYFKDLACHSQGQTVPCGSYITSIVIITLITNQKSRVTTLMEETKIMQFKTWQSKISDFRISKYSHGFLNGFHRRRTHLVEDSRDLLTS